VHNSGNSRLLQLVHTPFPGPIGHSYLFNARSMEGVCCWVTVGTSSLLRVLLQFQTFWTSLTWKKSGKAGRWDRPKRKVVDAIVPAVLRCVVLQRTADCVRIYDVAFVTFRLLLLNYFRKGHKFKPFCNLNFCTKLTLFCRQVYRLSCAKWHAI